MKPVHHGRFCRPTPRSVGNGTVLAVPGWRPVLAADAVSQGAGRRPRVRPVGRASWILAVIQELPIERCSKPLPMATGRRTELQFGRRPYPPL